MATPRANDLFLDTSGLLCALDTKDPLHGTAANIWLSALRQKRGLVTTNYVIAELVALLTMSRYGP